jgi:uncharacterized protein (TIGR03437 family)
VIARVLLLLVPALASAASSSLQIVPTTANSTARGVVPMLNGSVAVFGTVHSNGCVVDVPGICNQTETPLLSILSASGNQTAALTSTALGRGNSTIAGAAIDASGNFWIVGETDSDDFPLVRQLFSKKAAYQKTGFVAKLDPSLKILFSTFLGGQPALGQTNALCVALDPAGNAWVVGNTDDVNFPTTGPVFGVGTPSATYIGDAGFMTYTFVVKISSGPFGILGLQHQLFFSRLLGGNGYSTIDCSESCPEISTTTPDFIAVGTDGSLTIAGRSDATNFPITANAYQGGNGVFVSRISADGSELIWSTGFGIPSATLALEKNPDFASSVALDNANDVYLTGFTYEPIATTPGVLQSQAQLGQTDGNGFVVKLSPDATRLLFATNLTATIAGVTLDSARNAWVTGHATNIPSGGLDFALELNSDATALQQIFSFLPPTATQAPAFDSNGNLVLLASAGNLVRLNAATALTASAVFAITNSAIPLAAASVASGELVTLYGVGLGPAVGIAGKPDQNGLFPTELGGVRVVVGGVAAALLYVGRDQINFQAPFFGPYGQTTGGAAAPQTVLVATPTGPLPALQAQTAGSIGIFAVLNEDGSANSASNPAADGSIVTLYLTGLGALSSSARSGAISPSAMSTFQYGIEVKWATESLDVLYAGAAPGMINGLDQVNVRLPLDVPNPQVTVQIVGAGSVGQGMTISPVTGAPVGGTVMVFAK